MPKKISKTTSLENFQQKYSLPLAVLLGLTGVVYFSITSYAKERLPINIEKDFRENSCSTKFGKPLVNVEQKISNELVQGSLGNNWAIQDYERKITVWNTATENVYCAEVKQEGGFRTIAGQQSPAGNYVIENSRKGKFENNYIVTITSRNFEPSVKTKGSLNKIDVQCDTTTFECKEDSQWVIKYFPIYSIENKYFGAEYKLDNKNIWINSFGGTYGDIN